MQNGFTTLRWEYYKWLQSLKVSLSRNLQYKINFFLSMIIPVFVFFIIKYNLWHSIYTTNSYEYIQGYSLSKMIEYQFWILILELFVRSYFFSQNISNDIRLGRISAFLLYPFNFISYQMNLFLSDKIIQIFIGSFSLLVAFLFGWVEIPSMNIWIKAGIFICLINIFWFFIQLFIGFLAFWLEQTWSLNASIRFIAFFLSGSIIPLEFYPETLAAILMWTPFPYLSYIPVKVLMGENIDIGFSIFILLMWSFILFGCVQWIWKKGLKLYTGAGI